MRVVSGSARGRRLQAPAGRDVRPTTDRVREAVFSSLTSLGALDGATVVDLFAGTGALGIEALSRGAASATFVDTSDAALRVVRANLDATGLADRALVVRADARTWAAGAPHVDLALLDPPYAYDGWDPLLAVLDADVAVLESDREIDPGPRWEVARSKRHGSTVVRIVLRRDAP